MRLRGQLLLSLCVVVLFGGSVSLLVLFSPSASADASETPDEPTEASAPSGDEPPPEDDLPPRDFFAQYPAGEGEGVQSYEQLDETEKASLDDSALWAETGNGHAVHSKWERASTERKRRARVLRAQQVSGTQGFDELGVN